MILKKSLDVPKFTENDYEIRIFLNVFFSHNNDKKQNPKYLQDLGLSRQPTRHVCKHGKKPMWPGDPQAYCVKTK